MKYHIDEGGYCDCGRAVAHVLTHDGTFGRWAIIDRDGGELCDE